MMQLGFHSTIFSLRLGKDSVTTNMAGNCPNVPSKIPSFKIFYPCLTKNMLNVYAVSNGLPSFKTSGGFMLMNVEMP